MRHLRICLTTLIFFALISWAGAHQKVVVVPLQGSSGTNLDNIITVSPQGGDFTSPVAAVNSISGNSSTNRYLVFIGPGVYTLTQPLVLKSYVDVRGSGEDATILTGSISSSTIGPSSAMVVGATFSGLADLSIRNTGGGNYSTGIYNSGATYDISNVDVQAWGSALGAFGTCASYGVYNSNSSHPTISNSYLYGSGRWAYGIYNDNSNPALKYVELAAWVNEGSVSSAGYGISSNNSSYPTIRYSMISGPSYGLQQDGGSVRVSYSTIINSKDTGGSPDIECMYSDNGLGSMLDVDCSTLMAP